MVVSTIAKWSLSWDILSGLLLTLKNSFFSGYFVIMMSYGLYALPRSLLHCALPVMRLNYLKNEATKLVVCMKQLARRYSEQVRPNLDALRSNLKTRIADADMQVKLLTVETE